MPGSDGFPVRFCLFFFQLNAILWGSSWGFLSPNTTENTSVPASFSQTSCNQTEKPSLGDSTVINFSINLGAPGYGFSHCWLILQWYTLNQGWNTSCPVSVNRSNFILSKWMKLQSLLVLDPVFYVLLNYWGAVGWKGRAQGNKGDDHKEGPCGHDSREIFAWPWNSEQRLNPSTSPLPSESLNLSTSQGF